MRMFVPRASILAILAVTAAACSSRRTVVITPKPPRYVEIEVEVYDPKTNGVWQGVGVRPVEAYHEWSRRTVPAGDPDLWLFTDETGRVLFDSAFLGDADLGFLEDQAGLAIIESDRDLDEAFVLLEIDALGFDRVFVDVPISWHQPSVLVSVPFEPTPPHILEDDGGAGDDGEPRRFAPRTITPRPAKSVAAEAAVSGVDA
ncbi:MAG TPA: hypothetical protein VK081_06455 [Planctomycetota bacterium]|nr:hypothetical protein [Planctomycetota bacterium]